MNTALKSTNVLVSEYQKQVSDTDRFRSEDMTPVLLGLFGEVGSVMSTSKKLQREGSAFVGYQRDVEEELGDALWYLTALCRRVNIQLTDLFDEALQGPGFTKSIAANAESHRPLSLVISADQIASLDDVLLRLGGHAARLLTIANDRQHARPILLDFTRAYLEAVQASGVSFASVLRGNIAKVRGRFLKPDPNHLPDFDRTFPAEEQLPRQFQIEITQRPNGRSYLRWNGVFIGDPLSDNIADPDAYRFHDVFHFANAAILHWSPTFRALIKHKRKSNPKVDEAQDSGRAIVVDEGLSAFIFAQAKSLNFFEGQTSISFDLLKSVRNFVQGYEVEQCPLKLWEDAILQGYAVFRQMRQHNGGIVIGDRNERTLRFKAL
ncbi:MAG: pyrophosphatase [Alphaproteobacteria bacterium PA3]|nr:MAG: pyrophosphatase [Alphaproteobacteria bacterium PA3]